jgi:hypothetical protein
MGNCARRVGTRLDFGQRNGKLRSQSRNRGQLRTQKWEIALSESEPDSTSDTKSGNPVVRVRTWLNFGHRNGKLRCQSRNPCQLRTEKAEIPAPESEPGPTSDTKSGNPGARVRTRLDYGHIKHPAHSVRTRHDLNKDKHILSPHSNPPMPTGISNNGSNRISLHFKSIF